MSAEQLAHWINERWAIHVKKDIQNLPKPWSVDPIFQRVRFCNVHREDDAVTKWIRENWSTHESPAWWFVLGRMLNYTPTLEDIVSYGVCGDETDRSTSALPSLDGLADGLKAKREDGEKLFTSAYTISTCGKKLDKVDYVISVCREVSRVEARWLPSDMGSLGAAHHAIMRIDGLGSFLSAQVVADMKNTKGHPLADAPDWWSWSAPGPGSLRGLNWFFYDDPDGPITAPGYANAIQECWSKTSPLIKSEVPAISMQDFQNCLCEFSKYRKVQKFNGHVRNKFQGT